MVDIIFDSFTILYIWLVQTFANEMDAILDIFAGCGGLGVACQELGRHYLGIENDEELVGACFQNFS